MPVETIERLTAREARLKQAATKVGDQDAARSRTLGKRLRRAQRKRRRLAVRAQRQAAKPEAKQE